MRKAGGRDELVEHIGSAHTDAELGVLLERARRVIAGDQDVLDFEVPARAQRVSDPTPGPDVCSAQPPCETEERRSGWRGRSASQRPVRAPLRIWVFASAVPVPTRTSLTLTRH